MTAPIYPLQDKFCIAIEHDTIFASKYSSSTAIMLHNCSVLYCPRSLMMLNVHPVLIKQATIKL